MKQHLHYPRTRRRFDASYCVKLTEQHLSRWENLIKKFDVFQVFIRKNSFCFSHSKPIFYGPERLLHVSLGFISQKGNSCTSFKTIPIPNDHRQLLCPPDKAWPVWACVSRPTAISCFLVRFHPLTIMRIAHPVLSEPWFSRTLGVARFSTGSPKCIQSSTRFACTSFTKTYNLNTRWRHLLGGWTVLLFLDLSCRLGCLAPADWVITKKRKTAKPKNKDFLRHLWCLEKNPK